MKESDSYQTPEFFRHIGLPVLASIQRLRRKNFLSQLIRQFMEPWPVQINMSGSDYATYH